MANYETIAQDDLEENIQPEYVLRPMANRLMTCVGDVAAKRVCDVGVGHGVLLDHMLEAGAAHVTGIDISVAYLERFVGVSDVRVLLANAENLPFREEFDLIVAADVFEHVLSPADFLVSVKEALVPGGTLVVRVPYRENLTQYARRHGCQYDLVHLRSFTRDSLVDLLRRAGFSVAASQYDGFYASRMRRAITPFFDRSPLVRRAYAALLRTLGESEATPAWAGAGMNPLVGRLLMTPTAITVRARRPDERIGSRVAG